jgi:hypothetical protein
MAVAALGLAVLFGVVAAFIEFPPAWMELPPATPLVQARAILISFALSLGLAWVAAKLWRFDEVPAPAVPTAVAKPRSSSLQFVFLLFLVSAVLMAIAAAAVSFRGNARLMQSALFVGALAWIYLRPGEVRETRRSKATPWLMLLNGEFWTIGITAVTVIVLIFKKLIA